jgi:predicted aconitase
MLDADALYPVLGHLLGREAGTAVAAIVDLPANTPDDRLKALGAAAASSGSVAMFHAVGRTPEAPTLEAATGGSPVPEVLVTMDRLRAARDELGTSAGDTLGAVSVGTPHASRSELERLAALVVGARPRVPLYVNTGRDVLADAERSGTIAALEAAGVQVVTDTCTYLTPIIHDLEGPVMTDSAKWAWYAPANIGVDVVFGGMEECVRSAAAGRVIRDETLWADD